MSSNFAVRWRDLTSMFAETKSNVTIKNKTKVLLRFERKSLDVHFYTYVIHARILLKYSTQPIDEFFFYRQVMVDIQTAFFSFFFFFVCLDGWLLLRAHSGLRWTYRRLNRQCAKMVEGWFSNETAKAKISGAISTKVKYILFCLYLYVLWPVIHPLCTTQHTNYNIRASIY